MSDSSEHRLDKYLTEGEHLVVATHRHWAAITEPLATATATLLLIGAAFAGGAPAALVQALLLGWLAVFGRAVLRVWEWNMEWFVATDQRLLLVYGFIIRKVDMLPLGKVTDMTFRRSLLGRLLGYGTFVLESASQDQALSDVRFIPNPNETYLRIVQTIFKTGPDPEDSTVLPDDVDGVDADVDLMEADGPTHHAYDPWEEDDPTGRPSLRADLARLGRRSTGRGKKGADGDTLGFSMGGVRATNGNNPVADHARRRRRSGDYAETLYSSLGSTHADPWEDETPDPPRGPARWWGRHR